MFRTTSVALKEAQWSFLVNEQNLCSHSVLFTKKHCVLSLSSNKHVESIKNKKRRVFYTKHTGHLRSQM